MTLTLRRIATGVAAVTIAGASLLSAGGAAHGTTPPPWEPDPSSVGGLTFYDSTGAVITGGSVNDSPLAAYVEGSNTVRTGDDVASLFGYLPVKGVAIGNWQGEQLSGSTKYPNQDAPAPLKTSTLPFVTGAAGDETVGELAQDFPNTDVSTDGYAGIYQLRLETGAPHLGLTPKYDSADIEITGTGASATWSVVYSQAPATATTTSLSVSPSSKADNGAAVKLSATVSPAAATGSVEFLDGTKVLKSTAVAGGKASFSTSTLADGTHSLTAKFVPGSGAYTGSTSTAHTLKVVATPTTVTLKASKSSIVKGKKLTLTATEKPAAAGKVAFYDGSKKLGTVSVKKGKATFSTTKLAVGSHTLKAKFTPTSTKADAASTSKTVKVKVTK
jgi:Bacterial Ig-like domain (group 3)